eukprot:UN09487
MSDSSSERKGTKRLASSEGSDKRRKLDHRGSSGVQWSKNADGGMWCKLGSKKRVTVKKFKGRLYVDFREFYLDEKSGMFKPT